MGKAKMIGQFRPYLPSSRADMRRMKQFRRNREYTDKHQSTLERSREKKLIREKEARYGN